MSSSNVQWLTEESGYVVLIPREASGKEVEQYQPITNEEVSIWAVEFYNWLTADMNGMKALVSESISKSVNVQHPVPQLVDAYILMISKQNASYDHMNKVFETLWHNVYARHTANIVQFKVFTVNVTRGMAVSAAKVLHNLKDLKDIFTSQITSNSGAWARTATVLGERQDTANVLAIQLEAQWLQMEENKLNAERAIARVQNTPHIEMEDNRKKAEEDLKKQRSELASTKREMNANTKWWQWGFTEFQEHTEDELKDAPKNTTHSIWSLANSIPADDKLENPDGNPNQPQDEVVMDAPSSIEESTVDELGHGKSSKMMTLRTSHYHLLHHHAVRPEVGEKITPEEEE